MAIVPTTHAPIYPHDTSHLPPWRPWLAEDQPLRQAGMTYWLGRTLLAAQHEAWGCQRRQQAHWQRWTN